MCWKAQFSSEVGNARDRPWPLHDAHTRFDASPFSGRRYLGSCTARPPRPRHRRGAMQIAPTIAASLQAGSIRNRGRGPQCSGRGSGELWPLLGDGAQSPRRLIGPHHPKVATTPQGRPFGQAPRGRRRVARHQAPPRDAIGWPAVAVHLRARASPHRAGASTPTSSRRRRTPWACAQNASKSIRPSTSPQGSWSRNPSAGCPRSFHGGLVRPLPRPPSPDLPHPRRVGSRSGPWPPRGAPAATGTRRKSRA